MSVSENYKLFVIDQLSGLGTVTSKHMFGGVGLYAEGLFFALIDDDVLYFKVDDSNKTMYEELEMGPFRPYNDSRSMNYYEVPADVIEDREQLQEWALKSIDIARKKKK